jgi:murein DD-endopeptidase MepM/ murein hydrolase activator NlpD
MQTAPMAFIWPVHGNISRGLEQDETRRHDGIDIAAPKGTPIQAAAAGEVVFSGWGPEGYGQMIILRHRSDLFTIYAHNDQNLVQRGEYVQQGNRIATVGQTGRATGNHLHFEIRHKTMPVIPERWLPQRSQNIVSLDRG